MNRKSIVLGVVALSGWSVVLSGAFSKSVNPSDRRPASEIPFIDLVAQCEKREVDWYKTNIYQQARRPANYDESQEFERTFIRDIELNQKKSNYWIGHGDFGANKGELEIYAFMETKVEAAFEAPGLDGVMYKHAKQACVTIDGTVLVDKKEMSQIPQRTVCSYNAFKIKDEWFLDTATFKLDTLAPYISDVAFRFPSVSEEKGWFDFFDSGRSEWITSYTFQWKPVPNAKTYFDERFADESQLAKTVSQFWRKDLEDKIKRAGVTK